MSENFNAKGEIELELKGLIGDIDALTDKIAALNEQFGHSTDVFDKIESRVNSAGKAARTAAGDLDETTGSTEKLKGASEQAAEMALPRLRYALYDVATTAGVMSASLTAAGAAVLVMSANYERSFTDVERTTLASAETTAKLREDLMQLTREIPESWGNITEIASVGAQLDIAEESLASFTETTTKFSTVTGVSAEQSAMAFGSLGQLLDVTASEYENMGSAIAYVGVTSVATDAEIIKMSQRLAASAANAGMTAQEVIALSGALASLRIAPERAQGVMEVYFKNLNSAIAEGGERLEAFAHYSGMSTDAVAEMVATDPAQFFRSLSAGLGSLDPVSTTLALEELGLSGIRAGEVFTRVSNNLEVFDQAMANSNKAWQDGTHLAHAYGLVVDDLASKWQIFLNAVGEAGAGIGDAIAPIAKFSLDVITPMFQAFADFAGTDFGKGFLIASSVLGGIVASLAAIVGTGALALASMAALSTATKELALSSGTAALSLRGLGAAFTQVSAQAGLSTGAINTFKWALTATGIGAAVVLLGTLATAFVQAGLDAEGAFNKYVGSAGGLAEALAQDTADYHAAVAEGATDVADSYTLISNSAQNVTPSLDESNERLTNAATILGVDLPASSEAATTALEAQTVALGANGIAWLQNALMQSEAFKDLVNDDEVVALFEAKMITFEDLVTAAAQDGQAGIDRLWANVAAQNNVSASIFYEGMAAWFVNAIASIREYLRYMGELWFTAEGWVNSDKVTARHEKRQSEIWSNETPYRSSIQGINQTALGSVREMGFLDQAVKGLNESLGSSAPDDYANGLGNAGGAAGRAAEKVYTLKDYASDLAKVWERAFEIRFSGEQTMDKIASSWSKIRKEINDAADAIAKYQAEMAELNADKSTMQYWLMVAENYGDVLRAEELRAKLAAQDVKLAEASKKLAAEQDKTNKTLTGNSDAAIKNRAELLNLVSSYQDHIGALAASGMSSEELAVKTAQLKQQFIDQAVQLGYSRNEVMKYAAAFDDVTVAINKIPRNITVSANANPAIQAFNEMRAAANNASSAINGLRNNAARGIPSMGGTAAKIAALQAESANLAAWAEQQRRMNPPRYSDALDWRIAEVKRQLAAYGYKRGGYTGDGGVNDVAGVVHGKEFVFSAPAVANLGVKNLALLHEAAKAGRGASAASMAQPGTMVVELSPVDRQLLVDVKNAAGVSISADALTRATLAGAANAGRTGRG